jgi:RNA-binding protein YlmH
VDKEFYVHFRPDEHAYVDRCLEWIARAEQQHQSKLTDFLDPRQSFILETLVRREPDVAVRFEGGWEEAERRRALIAPEYYNVESEDMGILVLSVSSGDNKFLTLEHGDYMGSILGLGIKRDKIGDIHVHETGCHCLVTEDIAPFLQMNLHQVHRVNVQTELLPLTELKVAKPELQEMELTAASMRLDCIASDVFRLSRAKVMTPIKAGRLRLNWKVEEDPSKALHPGDVVSLQGFGRFKVLETDGITKKGRIRVKVAKFV